MEQQKESPIIITQDSTPIRNLGPEKRRQYYREKKRLSRAKTRKCKICGAQATIKVLSTQELLCDKEDILRLKNKYPTKKEKQGE